MTEHAHIARHRKRARPLYLELKALGLEIRARDHPYHPPGYRISVGGLESLSPTHADRLQQRILDNEEGLINALLCKQDPALEAIRREGAHP